MWNTDRGDGGLEKNPLQSALYIVKVGKFLLTVCPPFFFFFFGAEKIASTNYFPSRIFGTYY